MLKFCETFCEKNVSVLFIATFAYGAPSTHYQYTTFQATTATYTPRTKSCHVKQNANYKTHICIYLYIYICVCVCARGCACMYISPLSLYIYVGVYTCIHACTCLLLVTLMHWHRQVSGFRIEMRQVAFIWWDQDSNPWVCGIHSPADLIPAHKPIEPPRMKLKTSTQQLVPMTALPVGFRTWLWRFICLLLMILMQWHTWLALKMSFREAFNSPMVCPYWQICSVICVRN